jgi:hypothetical protein
MSDRQKRMAWITVAIGVAVAIPTLTGCDVARCDPHAIDGVACPK